MDIAELNQYNNMFPDAEYSGPKPHSHDWLGELIETALTYHTDNDSNDVLGVVREFGGWVAGGFINAILTGRDPSDIDIYLPSQEALLVIGTEITPITISLTEKSWLLAPPNVDGSPPIQIIHYFQPQTAEDIFDKFDFTVCMAAYNLKTKEVSLHPRFMKDLIARKLIFNHKTDFPIASAMRVAKYREYGFNITNLEMFKVYKAITDLNIDTVEEFQEQIGGVYGTIFEKQQTWDDFYGQDEVKYSKVQGADEAPTFHDAIGLNILKQYSLENVTLVCGELILEDGEITDKYNITPYSFTPTTISTGERVRREPQCKSIEPYAHITRNTGDKVLWVLAYEMNEDPDKDDYIVHDLDITVGDFNSLNPIQRLEYVAKRVHSQ